ncbi:MAG TPA: hypothetical protein ACFYD7_05810 [Candidatus Wujingus californicus]|uniref:SLAC1 family transporter n=1 Tax=Candidatus Wujingus californicus TaxID=3367618 RepID=UPI004027C6C5
MSPAYFAMVMATGIISIAVHLLGMSLVAVALFWLNIVTRSLSSSPKRFVFQYYFFGVAEDFFDIMLRCKRLPRHQ